MKGLNRQLALIGIASLVFSVGYGAVWFLIPKLARSGLGLDLWTVGLLVALPSAVTLIFDIPSGALSDRVGRKKMVYAGAALVVPAAIILASVNSVEMFILFAAIMGLSSAIVIPAARALVMENCNKGKEAEGFGIMMSLMVLGNVIGAVAAGWMIERGVTACLGDMALFYAVTTCLAYLPMRFIKEKAKKGRRGLLWPALRDFKALKSAGLVVIYVSFILTLVDSVVWGFEPLMDEESGSGAAFLGVLMVALTASLVLLQPFGGWLADRFGDMRMLLAGLGVGGISLMAFSAQTNETLLLLTALLFSLGMALAWPAVSGTITEISANRQRGGIAGVWMMFTDLACLVGPVFGGAITLFSGTVSSVFFTMGAMLVVSVIPLALLKR